MRIALLGAGGFIGSHLAEHLIRQGEHDVVGVDIDLEKLEGITGPRFEVLKLDIADPIVEDVVVSSDVVVDLVAHANPSLYVEKPIEVFELNFLRNLDMINLCVRHRKRIVQYSTCEVYGRPSASAFSEDSDLVLGPISKQRWIYACSKQLLERVIYAHGANGALEYTVIRPFNFIGTRFDYLVPPHTRGGPRVFAHFMSALLSGGPMYLVNGGLQHRSFTHIEDANAAFQLVLDHPGARNEIFNVGNPANDISVRGLAQLMQEVYEELTGKSPGCEVIEISGEEFYGEGYEDSDRVPPDVAKLTSLGWSPQRGLRDTLREVMAEYLALHRPATTAGRGVRAAS